MAGPPKREIPAKLDRGILEGLVDRYLEAVVAHDPKRLPLAKDARFTEQGQELEIGDGFWGTASGIGNYKFYVVDPGAGQVGAFATMTEGDNKNGVLVGLRLRVELGLITEIETAFYRRGGGPAWNDAGIDNLNKASRPAPMWLEAIPEAKRATRQELITTANYYFAGLQNNDGLGYYPFTDDCHRLENGVATSNNKEIMGANSTFNPMGMGVKEQFETGYYGVVTRIHDRRFPIVDRERGIVFAFGTFDHAGTVKAVKLTKGRGEYPMTFFSRPSSILIFEAFKIENGLIRQVEALGSSVPYHMKTGWPGGISGD